MHRASVSFALLNEGKIIKSFIDALPISSGNYQEWMIDLRFHYLKQNELPSMDCWHLDFFTPEQKDAKLYLCCLGDCSLTEVITSEVEVSDLPTNDKETFPTWDEEVRSQSHSSVVVSPGNIYQYTTQTLHKGTQATYDGVRIFMRACHNPAVRHSNESPTHALMWQPGGKYSATKAMYVRG